MWLDKLIFSVQGFSFNFFQTAVDLLFYDPVTQLNILMFLAVIREQKLLDAKRCWVSN